MKVSIVAAAALALLPLCSDAAEPLRARLVRDLNTTFSTGQSAAHGFTAGPGRVYFAATTPETGTELFSIDGTPPNGDLRLEVDLAPGTASSYPRANQTWAGTRTLYFVTGATDQPATLHALDTTTRTATDLDGFPVSPAGASVLIGDAIVAGDRLFFVPADDSMPLWTSDGTPSGTIALDAAFGPDRHIARGSFVADGDVAYFIVNGSAPSSAALWRSDGTLAGTSQVALLDGTSSIYTLCPLNYDGAYWMLTQTGVWRHAFGSDSIERLGDVPYNGLFECRASGMGSSLYFLVTPIDYPTAPEELWRSGPLVGDTALVSAIANEEDWPNTATDLTTIGNRLVFWRHALWRSDGSAAGTGEMSPAEGKVQSWQPACCFRRVGDELVFWGTGALQPTPAPLWATDGTDAGTHSLGTPFAISTQDAAVLGGRLFGTFAGEFGTEEPINAWPEIWSTDATPERTEPVATIWPTTGPALGYFQYFGMSAADGTDLLFLAPDFTGSSDPTNLLWKSNGSGAGTFALPKSAYAGYEIDAFASGGDHRTIFQTDDAGAGIYVADALFDSATLVDGEPAGPLHGYQAASGPNVFFTCDSGSTFRALCGLDATLSARTQLAPNVGDGQIFTAGSLPGIGLFFAEDSAIPKIWSLWRTDGTTGGTAALMPLMPYGSNGYASAPAIAHDGLLYFTGCDVASGQCSIFASDGTAAGTHPLFAIGFDASLSFAFVGSRLLVVTGAFAQGSGGNPYQGYRLYGYDLVAGGGATLLLDVEAQGGFAVYMSMLATGTDSAHFAVASCDSGGTCNGTLWNSDGTLVNTQPIATPIPWQPTARVFAAFDASHAVFTCQSPDIGEELCETDGTVEGTRLVRDIFPGATASSITLQEIGGKLYFAADDGHHGLELWTLDGDAIFADGFDAH